MFSLWGNVTVTWIVPSFVISPLTILRKLKITLEKRTEAAFFRKIWLQFEMWDWAHILYSRKKGLKLFHLLWKENQGIPGYQFGHKRAKPFYTITKKVIILFRRIMRLSNVAWPRKYLLVWKWPWTTTTLFPQPSQIAGSGDLRLFGQSVYRKEPLGICDMTQIWSIKPKPATPVPST